MPQMRLILTIYLCYETTKCRSGFPLPSAGAKAGLPAAALPFLSCDFAAYLCAKYLRCKITAQPQPRPFKSRAQKRQAL